MKSGKALDANVYVDMAGLISLQHKARDLNFLPGRSARSLWHGRHQSRLRGRGLNLEELRPYYPGDDTRYMDWKATIRTGHPHVRTYTEERDKSALILVDQRISMFFGSRKKMKSVVAAKIAAAAAWGVFSSGDRVGALVFNDDRIVDVRPRRNQATVLRLLHTIVTFNQRLKVGRDSPNQNDDQFNEVLFRAEKLAAHDFLVIIVSDLGGWNETSVKRIKRIARHNDVVAFHIYDPLEKNLPPAGHYVVSNGRLQIHFDARKKSLQRQFSEHFMNKVDYLQAELKKHDVPVLLADTVQDSWSHPPSVIPKRIPRP